MADNVKVEGKDECIQVVVRSRPFNTKEKNEGRANIINMNMAGNQVVISNPDTKNPSDDKSFTFDNVFDDTTQQKLFYEDCCFNLVENVLEGFNCTIFAYGQTGCGKSWTMQGGGNTPELRGVIPNACAHIFEFVKASMDIEFLIRCSYLEIYSEEIRDLLIGPTAVGKQAIKCELKEDPTKGVFVKNLTDVVVDSESQMAAQLDKGIKLRTVASTNMNDQSSRSHSIFTITVEMSTKDSVTGKDMVRVGKLNLVDLAGSERQKKTGATGDTLKEGAKINLSLSALGNVISALSEGKSKHIPYRDSKLTRLLQDSLGGNTKTLMIAAIGPADYNYDESLSTLRYANRAKNIQNKPKINEDPKDTMIREFKEEIEKLRLMLQSQTNTGSSNSSSNGSNNNDLDDHYQQQQQQQQQLLQQLQEQQQRLSQNQINNEEYNLIQQQLKQKESEIEQERQMKQELVERLNRLQGSFVHGPDKGGSPFKMSLEQVKEREEADAQRKERKLRNKKKREQRQQDELLRIQNEKQMIEDELEELRLKSDADKSEEVEKGMKKIKKRYEKKLQQMSLDLLDVKDDYEGQKQQMLDTIREQEKDIKLYEQICQSLISDKELRKIVEKCWWNEDDREWIVPYGTQKKLSTGGGHSNGFSVSQSASSGLPSYYDSNNSKNIYNNMNNLSASSSSSALPSITSTSQQRLSALPQIDNSSTGKIRKFTLPPSSGNNNNSYDTSSVLYMNEDSLYSMKDNYEDLFIEDRDMIYDGDGYSGSSGINNSMMKAQMLPNDSNSGSATTDKKKKKKKKMALLENISDEAGTGAEAGALNQWGFAAEGVVGGRKEDDSDNEYNDDDFDDDDSNSNSVSSNKYCNSNNNNSSASAGKFKGNQVNAKAAAPAAKMPSMPAIEKSKLTQNNPRQSRVATLLPVL